MKTIDKLERAGWVFQEYAGRKYLFRRGEEVVLYDLDVDEIVAYNNGVVAKVPDDLDLDIIFEKGV